MSDNQSAGASIINAPSSEPAPTPAPAPQMLSSDAAKLMQYDAAKKSVGVAYLLLIFFGWFGAHRFYLVETGTAVAMLVITIVSFFLIFVGIGLIGWIIIGIWSFVDLFLVPGIVRRKNEALALQIGMR
jgi:TM2 domain-containing membrane protein YozV